jgi:hypothetical protein
MSDEHGSVDYDAISRRHYEALVQSVAQRKQEYLDSAEFAALFRRMFLGYTELELTNWTAVFDEYRSPPRVAVEGDL